MHSDDPGLLVGSDSIGVCRGPGVYIFNKLLDDVAAAVWTHTLSSERREEVILVWIFFPFF